MKTFTKKLSLTVASMVLVSVAFLAPATAQSSLDEELEQYWATERDMEVLQERMFHREGRFGAGLFTGVMPSEPFFHYYPLGLRGSYHLTNALGVELSGSYMGGVLGRPTELTQFLHKEFCTEADSDDCDNMQGESTFDAATQTKDIFQWRANAMALWSPFYGKLSALQRKLVHFDLNVGAGLGAVGIERPEPDRSEASTTATVELVLGGGAHFYVNDNVAVRLDVRGFLYRGAQLPSNQDSFLSQMEFPVEFNLGATYLF